eukprot:6702820-Pyramimonas_sp.AAC.1
MAALRSKAASTNAFVVDCAALIRKSIESCVDGGSPFSRVWRHISRAPPAGEWLHLVETKGHRKESEAVNELDL